MAHAFISPGRQPISDANFFMSNAKASNLSCLSFSAAEVCPFTLAAFLAYRARAIVTRPLDLQELSFLVGGSSPPASASLVPGLHERWSTARTWHAV